ncbi:MAG: malto-oligosyltrehalose synthase [Candidatus Sulfotelmatobacter sp.]
MPATTRIAAVVGGLVRKNMNSPSPIPRATYRLQLNHEFTFAQATEIVPYLSAIGISHCYISPFLKARPGSMHGYDIVDHNSLNPEIGSPEEFDRFVGVLHEHGMGLILDIVPNHMAVMGSDNAWWLDVLENGEASSYAGFFDIDWHPSKEELQGKVLVPVLPDHYGAVLESGELKLVFREPTGEFDICFQDNRFPIDPREYTRVLQPCTEKLTALMGEQNSDLLEFQSIITAFSHLPGRQELDNSRTAERNRDKEIHKRRLAALCQRVPEIAAAIKEEVKELNGDPAVPSSFEALHELIKTQTFRLANWRVASDDINYRRFFDTNDLAGLRVENPQVFEATHKFILSLVASGKVDGLRVDHPDGLYDPAQYFERLRRSVIQARKESQDGESGAFYIVIEKILTGSERLPKHWPVNGTTGYDFSDLVNGLFVDSASASRFDTIYRNFIGDDTEYDDLAYACRKLIIRTSLVSELNVLANQLSRIALAKRRTCDFTLNSLRDAIAEVVASFPVYRTYVTSTEVSENDARYIGRAITAAKLRSPAADTSVFDFIHEVLLTRISEDQDSAYQKAVLGFAMKFQQFTSPVMAKGLEDTAFYRYNRLISLNDVGSDLHRFGVSVAEFHAANQERISDWPHSMLATSTHDSKRSEDVRARINALSEMPGQWRLRVHDWRRLNRSFKVLVNGEPAPARDDEYLLYQTLVGAWPTEPLIEENDWKAFRERIESYMMKAIREAKQNTSWINRNAEYENAVSSFVRAVLNPDSKNRFLKNFLPFQERVARLGVWNGLSQTLLKLTSPGVPDIYQGNDVFDFSLVDPDNRRPVDYAFHQQAFRSLPAVGGAPGASPTALLEVLNNDQLKLYLTWKTLCLRKGLADVFQKGDYIPLTAHGKRSDHVIAFLRTFQGTSVLIVAPRLIDRLLDGDDRAPIGARIWQDTNLQLPFGSYLRFRNAFTGEVLNFEEDGGYGKLNLANILASFPLALCFPE